jgi:uncharacterized protein YebE (UPF0316 family)
MLEMIFGALFIMCLRICDVTIGTFRTLLVVQGKKYHAGAAGFCEVLIWIFAMRYIVQHMDVNLNLIGYAAGYGLGNVLGITLEQKFAIGFAQITIISKHFTDQIADALRKAQFGVTIVPGEGGRGGVSILIIMIRRKDLKAARKIIDGIDHQCFIAIQASQPYRGFMPAGRK